MYLGQAFLRDAAPEPCLLLSLGSGRFWGAEPLQNAEFASTATIAINARCLVKMEDGHRAMLVAGVPIAGKSPERKAAHH